MISVSFEIPTSLLVSFSHLADYDFALAHLVLQDPYYAAFYTTQVRSERVVLLDNGKFELGEPLDTPHLLQAADTIRPTFVMAPDYYEDLERTKAAVVDFMRVNDNQRPVGLVPVGKTVDELVECYQWYVAVVVHDYPCVRALCPSFLGPRAAMLRSCEVVPIWHHLLGFSTWHELKETVLAIRQSVVPLSIDTSKPFSYAYARLRLGEERGRVKRAPFDATFDSFQRALARQNIQQFKETLHEHLSYGRLASRLPRVHEGA